MHLVELLRLRSRPFAGLFLGLTRRCPLHCAHCSTNSTMASEQSPAAWYEQFVGTFTPEDRPDVVLLSGGEPLLRPELVVRVAEQAHAVGTRVALLTGAYWAEHRAPPAVQRAIDAVDLLSISMDVFHEREVPRDAVMATLERRLGAGGSASVQTVGAGDGDPWVAELVADLEARFQSRLPILVGQLGPSGRDGDGDAGDGVAVPTPGRRPTAVDEHWAPVPEPCGFASWPVAGFDGTVTACCQQSVVDDAPGHLRLGHLTEDTWADVRDRGLQAPVLRALRVYGPRYLAARAGRPVTTYCETCRALDEDPTVADLADELTSTPGFAFTADFVADALGALPLRGVPARYTDLVARGYDGAVAAVATASAPEGAGGW